MKPIPNHRGHRYTVAQTSPSGRPLRVDFNTQAAGGLDGHLVKPGRVRSLDPEEQAGAPWVIRFKTPAGSRAWKKVGEGDEPIEKALDQALRFLAALPNTSTEFDRFMQATQERASLLCGTLMQDYVAAGCPDRQLRPRAGQAKAEVERVLALAGRYWSGRPAHGITLATLDDFMIWRAEDVAARRKAGTLRYPRGDGRRAGELELAALSNVFRYAVRRGRLDANPFNDRGTYRPCDEICNAQERQPSTDEELHAIGSWLARHERQVSAARLLFQALTGLRRGEYLLRWDAGPGQPGYRTPGLRNGHEVELLLVPREKRGLNPAVVIHPILEDFIRAWRGYCLGRWPGTPHWFPGSRCPDRPQQANESGRDLLEATKAMGLPLRTTHGFRAYYVTVRRSQGTSDVQIAEELGHRSGAGLVARVYGQPTQIFGSRSHDWLPTSGENLLRSIEGESLPKNG